MNMNTHVCTHHACTVHDDDDEYYTCTNLHLNSRAPYTYAARALGAHLYPSSSIGRRTHVDLTWLYPSSRAPSIAMASNQPALMNPLLSSYDWRQPRSGGPFAF